VITTRDVERIVSTLSADDMLGRRPFTEGIDRAAQFIAAEFSAVGLEPLEGQDSYLQEFPAYTLTTDSSAVVLDGIAVAEERCVFAVNQREIHWTGQDDVQVIAVDAEDNSMQAFSEIRRSDGNMLVLFHERQQTAVLHARATLHHGAGPEWQCGLRADQQRAPRRV
jgi:hypothetical protein